MEAIVGYQFREKLLYVVDLNERGWFKAHVEKQNGKEIFSLSNEDEGGWPGGDLDLVEDGYMRHALAAVPVLGEPLSLLTLAGLAAVTLGAVLGARAAPGGGPAR